MKSTPTTLDSKMPSGYKLLFCSLFKQNFLIQLSLLTISNPTHILSWALSAQALTMASTAIDYVKVINNFHVSKYESILSWSYLTY